MARINRQEAMKWHKFRDSQFFVIFVYFYNYSGPGFLDSELSYDETHWTECWRWVKGRSDRYFRRRSRRRLAVTVNWLALLRVV